MRGLFYFEKRRIFATLTFRFAPQSRAKRQMGAVSSTQPKFFYGVERVNKVLHFLRREDGAITVDWVVLSAAIIGLGMVVLIPIAFSTESSTQLIADGIENQPVGYGNN